MSDLVEVPRGKNQSDTAVLLLAAAQELNLPANSVQTTSFAFLVPTKVADKAGFGEKKAEPKEKPSESKGSGKKSTTASNKKKNRSVV